MAGAGEQLLINNYAQAIQQLDTISGTLAETMKKAVEGLRGLLDGTYSLDPKDTDKPHLVVTDNGWDFMPPSPVKEPSNGRAKEEKSKAVGAGKD